MTTQARHLYNKVLNNEEMVRNLLDDAANYDRGVSRNILFYDCEDIVNVEQDYQKSETVLVLEDGSKLAINDYGFLRVITK